MLLRAFEALRDHVPAGCRSSARRRGPGAAAGEHARAYRARPRRRRRQARAPARRRRAVRAVAGRRVVRHGADRGVRRRHAGRRLRHRRLPRRGRATASTACSSRAATRPRWPRRCATWRSTRPARSAWRGGAARCAERFAWPPIAAQLLEAYEDAIASCPPPEAPCGAPRGASARARRRRPSRAPAGCPARPGPGRPRPPGLGRRRARSAAPRWPPRPARGWRWSTSASSGSATRCALEPSWVLAGLALMCLRWSCARSPGTRSSGRAAGRPAALVDAVRGTSIGVLMSATLPRAWASPRARSSSPRRIGRAREGLPVVPGTLVSQTLLNVLALVVLGFVMFSSIGLFRGHKDALCGSPSCRWPAAGGARRAGAAARRPAVAPAAHGALGAKARAARRARARRPAGLRPPRLGAEAIAAALRVGAPVGRLLRAARRAGPRHHAGLAAAAAVLFAVNVTAAVPVTPSNLGVFQAACVAVLSTGYHVGRRRRSATASSCRPSRSRPRS